MSSLQSKTWLGAEETIALFAILSILLHLAFLFSTLKFQALAPSPLYLTLAFGGTLLLFDLLKKLLAFELGSTLTSGLSISPVDGKVTKLVRSGYNR